MVNKSSSSDITSHNEEEIHGQNLVPNTINTSPMNPTITTRPQPINNNSTSYDGDGENKKLDQQVRIPKRKVQPRSIAWAHFTFLDEDRGKANCNYCGSIYAANSTKNGTKNLLYHMRKCQLNPNNKKPETHVQTTLNYRPGVTSLEEGSLSCWKFDQERSRNKLTEMIMVHEIPFKFVEHYQFQDFVSSLQPKFRMPSRITVARDCFKLYIDEKTKLKELFSKLCQRVSFTTDTWTSIQKINYFCLTAHFVDDNWKLHKKIIDFSQIVSHKGEDIGKAIEESLIDWGLENKVQTITMDNASANDLACQYLKRKMVSRGTSICEGKHLHMRCVAHIINLIVWDGLKENNKSIERIRAAVKFVKQTPSRLHKFKECATIEKIQSEALLSLDVQTRWNSTYIMLNTAQKFERAFERFAEYDIMFTFDLESKHGLPTQEDWKVVRQLSKMLKSFYDVTVRISGYSYVTSAKCFLEICQLQELMNEWENDGEEHIRKMTANMKAKFNKYWGDIGKMNMLIYIAFVLDPRWKLEVLNASLCDFYDEFQTYDILSKVKNCLYEIYDEYKRLYAHHSEKSSSQAQSSQASSNATDYETYEARLVYKLKKTRADSGISMSSKNEIDKYLAEDLEENETNFDLLLWWKVNSPRFSILSMIARDVFAMPISTVASESAFSTGGRTLDQFRSSLSPKMVKALICGQDWIRNRPAINLEEELEYVEKLELELIDLENSESNHNEQTITLN